MCEVDDGRDLNEAWIGFLDWRVAALEGESTAQPEALEYRGMCVKDAHGNFTGIKPTIWASLASK